VEEAARSVRLRPRKEARDGDVKDVEESWH
jgi:hypothetical protein